MRDGVGTGIGGGSRVMPGFRLQQIPGRGRVSFETGSARRDAIDSGLDEIHPGSV